MSDTLTKVATIKKLEIIIRPGKLEAVKKALAASGYTGVTVSQAEGHGNQKGITHATGFRMDMMTKLRLEIVVPDSDVEKMIEAVKTVCPVDLSENIEGRPAHGGIIRPVLNPQERPDWPEALYHITHKSRQGYTLEAPSDFPLPTRVNALVAAVNAAFDELMKSCS